MTRNVYTVGQVNAYIKNMFTQDYMLNRIYVKGEVSNCKYHTSGHIYFSLKDESGTIACVMFAGQRGGLSFRMCEGQQIVVFGQVNVYERGGSYQLYAREIRLDGEGVLYERFQALKRELEEMGMFASEYKMPIPAYARRIGVVTAPTGAAIRDIMNISRRRNPFVQLILYPALVQGEGAKESIVKGIRMLDQDDIDGQRLADTEEKLHMLLHRKVEQYRHRFAVYMEQMKGLSPLQKLNQGYAYIEDVDKKSVRSIEQVRCGDHLSAYVTDGSIQMIVESVKEERHG